MNVHSMHETIVFFDSTCLLCNRTLQWILSNERSHTMQFAPLNGTHAKQYLQELHDLPDSLIVVHNGNHYILSSGVLLVLDQMGGMWSYMSRCFRIIPRFIRDAIYTYIANHRAAWFGRTEECLLMKGSLRERFLD
ncbi:MAG: thiol-disulfide oxidoreductase DCC family protein [Bacteroidota bacterium]